VEDDIVSSDSIIPENNAISGETRDKEDANIPAESTKVPVCEESIADEAGAAENERQPEDAAEKESCELSQTKEDVRLDEEILGSIGKLSEKIDELRGLFTEKIRYSEHEQKIVDQMHKELQKYKEDIYMMLLKPVLLDIVEVRESISRVSSAHAAKPEGERDIPLDTFSSYAADLQDVLEKNGVDVYRSEPGGKYVPGRQRAVKKIPADISVHGTIAESLGSGYELAGRVIMAEKVAIYLSEEKAVNNPAASSDKN
jgi:molecular chaperone GrpE (heat shock protein)